MPEQPSLISTITLVLVVVLMFAVLIIYIIYFLNKDISNEFGSEWDYITVSDTVTQITPHGNQVLSVNGASSSRGSNPDYLYIGKPSNVPYVRRIFVVYNNSNTNQLELRGNGINFECNNNGQLFIATLSGTLFIWKNKDTLIPIFIGNSQSI